MVLKELWGGCDVLEGVVVLKNSILTVSTLEGCGGFERSKTVLTVFSISFGRVCWS